MAKAWAVGAVCALWLSGGAVAEAATPTILALTSPPVRLGAGTLTDTVVVSGREDPQPAATIDFRLYVPGDADCSGSPAFQSLSIPVPVEMRPVSSTPFTPTAAGTYRWQAFYSGDANNAAASTPCNAVGQSTDVLQAIPAIATTASPVIALGSGTLTDTAAVSGRVSPLPGATIDFRLYGPDDPGCAGAPTFQSLGVPYPVAGDPVTSGAFTPTQPGTYRWRASYSGDANNTPVAGACNAGGETTAVTGQTSTNTPPTCPPEGLTSGAVYRGTHSQGDTVCFTVSADFSRITSFEAKHVRGDGCGFSQLTIFNRGLAISDRSFTDSDDSLTGSFPSDRGARGTMTLDAPGPFGSTCRTPTLTWSASTDATPPWAARPVSSPPRPQPGCPLTGAVVVLTSGNDTRSGTPGTNIMFGLDGADVLRGLAGDDCLYGDAGSDRLLGGRGRDRLFGGAGADVLSDARGRDTFSGGTGNDRIDARDETRSGRRIADAVSCGRGLRDVALVDRADRVRRDCERVRRRQ